MPSDRWDAITPCSPAVRALASALAMLVSTACGSSSPPSDGGAPNCPEPSGEPAQVAGALTIGTGSASTFEPMAPGSAQELVRGPQGGWMVTSTLRVDSALLGSDGRCAFLDVTTKVGTGEPTLLHIGLAEEDPEDPFWYYLNLPLFLAFDVDSLAGQTCTISASLRDDDVVTRGDVTVSLAHRE